ncbi:hypothetical protein G9A89_001294 [Geosiphon pyriformis]|nr:hypothetical protein G9A89_001294 [Geosiphon pyriformis]
MITQFPIFAVGSVVEDVLKKNQELWLVLQDMRKAYNLVSWEHLEKSLVRIKMYGKFIQFFGGIHKNCINRIMTDFGLTNGYCVHDDLDQEKINDISINNNKTVVILINSRVSTPYLSISGLPISIAKKGKSHQYLGIFLSTEGLSKPNLAKANSDIHFFTNLVLKKAVSCLVGILVLISEDALICKGLKFKSGLPLDFPSDTIHFSSFYGLKFFVQVQSKSKVASLVSFANSGGILGHLFFYRFYNLQVLCWRSVHLLSSLVCIHVNTSNNFLAGIVCVLLDCSLFLGGSLANPFWFCSGYGIAFVDQLCDHHGSVFDWHTFKCWKKLDSCGSVSEWFKLFVAFLNSRGFFLTQLSVSDGVGFLSILKSSDFVSFCNHFLQVGTDSLLVYTNGSLSNLDTVGCRAGTAAFFENIDSGLGVGVLDLMSSTLAELQAIALALECVPPLSSVQLFSNSQSALDVCKSELGLVCLNFHNQCWVKHYIVNVIYSKNLKVSWHKVKDYFGVLGNERTDTIAGNVSFSSWYFSHHLGEHFIMADGNVVFGNSRHFVHDIYCLICHVHWEVGSGSKFLASGLLSEVDWLRSFMVWHPDLHIATDFTSRPSANACSYFMKALHHQLPVAIQKHLYNRLYLSVLCLYCGDIKASDHVFSYKIDDSVVSGFSHFFLGILQFLFSCVSNSSVFMALYKSFIFNNWFCEAVTVFCNLKVASLEIIKFVCSLSLNFRNNVWSSCAKHCAYMEKNGLIPLDGLVLISVFGLVSELSAGVIRLLDIADAFGIHFGFRKSCLFFSGISDSVSVHIAA